MAAAHVSNRMLPSSSNGREPSVDDLDEFIDFPDFLAQDFAFDYNDMTRFPIARAANTPELFLDSTLHTAQIDQHRSIPLVETSPGWQVYRLTAGPCSVSPGTLILTPSTNPNDSDVSLFEEPDSSDAFSASPHSNVSPVDAFPTRRSGNSLAAFSRTMPDGRNRLQLGAITSAQTSQPVQESTTSFPAQDVPVNSNNQWSSFPQDSWTTGQQNPQQSYYNASNSFAYANLQHHGDEDILSGIDSQYGSLPIRTMLDGSVAATIDFVDTMSAQQQQQQQSQQQSQQQQQQRQAQFDFQHLHQTTFPPEAFYTQPVTSDGAFMTGPAPLRSQQLLAPMFSWLSGPTQSSTLDRNASLPEPYVQETAPNTLTEPHLEPTPSMTQRNSRVLALAHLRERPDAIIKSETSRGTIGPDRSHADRRRGGRAKGMNLDSKTRQNINEMRKTGACWSCRLQRDQCDHGDPCNRCLMKAQRGQMPYFPCDRSTLPVLIHDFLPPSMTEMHQKQSIEDFVVREVHQWDEANCIRVHLTCGYGPSLEWNLFEFVPATDELLWQLQYVQDPETGQEKQLYKWSPPLAMMKLNAGDADRFEEYMDILLQAEHLREFGWDFYQEESQRDSSEFQAGLLAQMCELYLKMQANKFRSLLRELLKLLIVTYIAAHTLTISAETLPSTLSAIQHTFTPENVVTEKYTSPRLANRQFKFFFCVIRNNMFDAILKQYQAILRQNQKGVKEDTWLMSFCVVLTFAMALEEVQRTLFIQARARTYKQECSEEDAMRQAENACARIDDRFGLLLGLFHCKYRDRTWGEGGSFGSSTPKLSDPAANEFLSEVRADVERRRDHLEARRDVTFSPENECLYTTRLTAKFLLPFLSLP